MQFIKSRRGFVQGAAAALSLVSSRTLAQWTDKPITLMHGFAAGGNADVVTRIAAESLSKQLGATFVVEARPGAGGTLAAATLSRAAPDGRTLGVLPGGHAVSAAIYKQLNFNPVDDFSWISMISDFPFVITTHKGHPAQTINDLIDGARRATEPPLWGSAGNGTGQHMAGELLASMSGIKLRHVPFRGGAQAVLELLAARIDFMVDSPTALMPHVKSGQLRALAVTGAERFFALPDVPTVAETGLAGYETTSWLGLAAPKNLPAEIVAQVNAGLAKSLTDPVVIERLKAIGSSPKPTTPAAFRDRVVADVAKWRHVVDVAKIERI